MHEINAREDLTKVEAYSLMVGAGVGAGIMAIPYLAEQVGLIGLAIILPFAWAISSLLHLMLAEVLFRTGRDLQVVELMNLYLFRGRVGKILLWVIFSFLSIAFLANLAAYISGSGEIVANLTGLPHRIGEVLIYLLSAGIVFFGLKTIGVAERYGAVLLVGLIVVIGLGSLRQEFQIRVKFSGAAPQWMALYGMVMYALWSFYSVPQVVKGLGKDHMGAVRAIVGGLAINGLLTLIVATIALGISGQVTEVAIVGISEELGAWAGWVGSLLTIAALVTSYWSVSLALADILRERTGISTRFAWLSATLPSLLVLWIGVWNFLEWLQLSAGATAIVVAVMTLPMYRQARRIGPVASPQWTLGRLGSPAVLIIVLLALILMALGSVLSFI